MVGGTLAYIYATNPGYVSFFAPVHLPDGATVTLLRLNALDSSASYDVLAKLFRRGLNNSSTVMAETSSITSGLSWETTSENTITAPTIDNHNYQYYVRVQVKGDEGPALRIGGVHVTYTIAAP